jgi:hypothetical protein
MKHDGPTRLQRGHGPSARLLDSARSDRPPSTSRSRALDLAATAGAFVATSPAPAAASVGPASAFKSMATWICIGAFGGGAVALGIAWFLAPARPHAAPPDAPAPLLEPEFSPLVAAPAISTPPPTNAAPANHAAPAPAANTTPALAANTNTTPALAPNPAPVPSADPAPPLTAARRALDLGDFRAAQRALDAFDASGASEEVKAQAAALRVRTAAASGDKLRARALARDFARDFPAHPLNAEVQKLAP